MTDTRSATHLSSPLSPASPSSARIAIIGGGWAGLSCAEALAHSRQQLGLTFDIDLFEAAPQFGGRARGLRRAPGEAPADNGQHLLIGAYRESLALIGRAGALDGQQWRRHWLRWSTEGSRLQLADHLQGLALVFSFWRGQGRPWRLAERGGLADWASLLGLRPRLVDGLLRPLAEAALNTGWQEASARVFRTILREALRLGPISLAAWHPREDLSQNAIEPVVSRLNELGVNTMAQSRIQSLHSLAIQPANEYRLQAHPSSSCEARAHLASRTYRAVVIALPAKSSHRLWSESGLSETPESARWAATTPRGIATLWVPIAPDARGSASPFPPGRLTALHLDSGEPVIAVARPAGPWGQLLGFVVSALPPRAERSPSFDHETAVRTLAGIWLAQCGLSSGLANQAKARWIEDPQATWACSADRCDRGEAWGPIETGLLGLLRASDDGYPGYPATIEAAVRSGRLTAHHLLKTIERL